MSNTLDITCDRGSDLFIDFLLEAPGVDFSGYVVRIVITEDLGLVPVINIASDDVGQTAITITLTDGLGCAIHLAHTQTLFPFEVGKYSISMESTGTIKEILLVGNLMVIGAAGEAL
jgi:hypothetical protein